MPSADRKKAQPFAATRPKEPAKAGKVCWGMQAKIVLLYSLLIFFALQLSGVYLVKSLESYYLRNYANNQLAQGELLGSFIRRYLLEDEQQGELISSLVAEFGGGIPGTETVTMVLDRHGRLLGGPEQKSLFFLKERVIQDDILLALTGNKVEAIRVDPETGARYYFLALPIKDLSTVVGVVFLRGSLEHIYLTLKEIKVMLISGWVVVIAIAIAISFLLTRTITRPIREVTSRAAALAQGDFTRLIEIHATDEIGELGKMFNFLTKRLQETLKEISTEKNKVEAILNYMTDGVVAFNKDGQAIHVNPAAKAIFQEAGLPAGQRLTWETMSETLFQKGEQPALFPAGEPATQEIHLGQAVENILQVHFAPFKEKGERQGMLVVLHDVTRERSLSRLQQEFVANVSHELRTPLTTIKNYIETLLNGAQEDPRVRTRFLEVVEKETERMVKLVRDLLVLSRFDYKEVQWVKEKADLGLLLVDVLHQVEHACREKDVSLAVTLPEESCQVFLDKDKIRQVLLNLLENAYKFTPAGGEITIRVFPGDECSICVAICDTGAGIPPADQERVFERFYRVDKTRSRASGGTGLGLPIAKQIIEAHGGKITLKSKPGEGTEMQFCLPVNGNHDCAGKKNSKA
ncbi:MAG: cell wall metabolism sensor histidine kinase WalK [Firmicutes bacterium]|nr:cell wall metabolism sensor histidine kinase WalK [Bacillota bacterium]